METSERSLIEETPEGKRTNMQRNSRRPARIAELTLQTFDWLASDLSQHRAPLTAFVVGAGDHGCALHRSSEIAVWRDADAIPAWTNVVQGRPNQKSPANTQTFR
jgi:hypothetical protein